MLRITNLLTILVLILLLNACGLSKVTVDEDNFAFKSYDNSERDQSIDLKEYTSPNSRADQDSNKLVIFCASGGGSRAAAFCTGIMLELEELMINDSLSRADNKRNILNEIDYFSTVSGGGWGVSSFIAYKYQQQKYSTPEFLMAKKKYNNSRFINKISSDSIEEFPTFNSYEKYLANRADFRYYKHQLWYLLLGKNGNIISSNVMTNRLNNGYLGWGYRRDVEEKTWCYLHPADVEFNTKYVDEIVLGDVFKPYGKIATLPMQIANATNIDNYKLIPFTPDILKQWNVSEYPHYLGENIPVSQKISNSYYDVPLASGTSASSGIPFLVGCTSLPAYKKDSKGNKIKYFLHLQDGGIIDQQAIHSAKIILNHEQEIKDSTKRIVFVIDASSSGIENQPKYKREIAGRFYNLWRVIAPFSTPDSQYALTRERIKLLEKEYNCTVIYLGIEVLLDPSLNPDNNKSDLPVRRKQVEKYFYTLYKHVRDEENYFLKVNTDERKLLYSYINSFLSTWFSSKGGDDGYVLKDEPESTAKIMFLAGRGVVQLKKQEIMDKLNNNK